MRVRDVIVRRGIQSVVHFTKTDGFLRMLDGRPPAVLSRLDLERQQYSQFLPCENSEFRKDEAWLGYVNLSITNINKYFYRYSCRNHPDAKWIILDFSPEILTHDGVLFVTTNNIYDTAERGCGACGLEALFRPQFHNGKCDLNRAKLGLPENTPTCNQAEVLYPEALSLEYLNRVYVQDEPSKHLVGAQAATCGVGHFEVVIAPERFTV